MKKSYHHCIETFLYLSGMKWEQNWIHTWQTRWPLASPERQECHLEDTAGHSRRQAGLVSEPRGRVHRTGSHRWPGQPRSHSGAGRAEEEPEQRGRPNGAGLVSLEIGRASCRERV